MAGHPQASQPLALRHHHTRIRPCSNQWIKISQLSIKFISALKSSQSNVLYMLLSSKFSFSFDPLNSSWFNVDPPLVWRTNSIVARVGDSVVVAGGVCQFEEPLHHQLRNHQ
ncbi:F-box/kelch-repeat protein [Forsythia ovata]|uniref:F-box/kelch-repeat protein n=1 Tax=Forsythia ovata TaxID=205694 RepID=A0ABD1U5E6_9LAMI